MFVSITGISFVPKEIGEHLVNIKKNGRHIPSSPITVMINQSEIGDASRVRVSGQGLSEARTFEPAEFIIDTRDAGVCRQRITNQMRVTDKYMWKCVRFQLLFYSRQSIYYLCGMFLSL